MKKQNIFQRLSLKAKVLIVAEVALFMLAIVSIFQVYQLKERQVLMSGKSVQSYAINMGTPIGKQFKLKYTEIQSVALNSVFESNNKDRIKSYLNAFVKINEGYDLLTFVDKDGNHIASSSTNYDEKKLDISSLENKNFASEGWFSNSIAGKFTDDEDKLLMGSFVGSVGFDSTVDAIYGEKRFGNNFATTVKDVDGNVIGVINARINFSWVEDAFQDTYSALLSEGIKSARLVLVNKEGKSLINFNPISNNGSTEILRTDKEVGVDFNSWGF